MLTYSQSHQRDQGIVCPGCLTKFTRAGNYVEHLENGHCERSNPITGIMRREFKESIQQKHVVKEILKDADYFRAGFHGDTLPALPNDLMSEDEPAALEHKEDGGVLLDHEDAEQKRGLIPLQAIKAATDQGDQVHRPLQGRASLWPGLPESPPPSIDSVMGSLSISSPAASISGSITSTKSASQFASDITSRRGGIKVLTETDPTSPIQSPSDANFSDTASDATTTAADFQKLPVAWTTGNSSQTLFKDAKPTPVPGDWDGWNKYEKGDKNMQQGPWWDKHSVHYRVPECYNPITRKYECPMADCKTSYKNNEKTGYDYIEDLEGHLINAHVKTKERCPLCLKIFQTAHAFISHAESGGKCKVKDTTYFDKFLNDITGGFLQAEQVHQPKVYKTSSTAAKGDEVVDGVMSTRFEAALPDDH